MSVPRGLRWATLWLGGGRHYADAQNLEPLELRPNLTAFVRTEMVPHLTLTYRIENYLDIQDEFYPDHPLPGRMHFFVAQLSL